MSYKPDNLPMRYRIGDIEISLVNLSLISNIFKELINNNQCGYVCITNARTCYLANKEVEYCEIQNNSLLTVPDGMPLVWIANNLGFTLVQKVSGKDLMDLLFTESNMNNYSHYFYGCSQKTIDLLQLKLKKKYPNIKIKGAVSPPFQILENFDLKSLADELNRLKPTFFWCGLGAPKQERFMALLQPKLDNTISLGVGLAFEYIAGTIKRVPKWIQNLGLEWLYVIIQQPKKFFRFYKPFLFIIKNVIKSKIK